MQNHLYFKTQQGYRIPDYVHMICLDCAKRKNGELRPESYSMKTLCDMCDTTKSNIYTISSFNWANYDPTV